MKQTLSSQQASVERDNGVSTIPEVTERDELTVQMRTVTPAIQFPIQGKVLKTVSQSKNFLSIHEQTEVVEYDEIYYLAKAD